jgi:hypothetical protein
MALNLPASSDNSHRVPIIKYDSRAGRIFRVDRSEQADGWESKPVEITQVFQAIFDLDNIETGWLHFPTGAAPSIRTVPAGQPLPDRPDSKHRGGFRLMLLLGRQSGGDVREMASTAQVSKNGMDKLDDDFKAGRVANPGLLPVVRLAGTTAITTQGKANGQPVSSTNYQPIWQIVKWVPRPPELMPEAIAALVGGAAAQQAQQPAPAASPPPPSPQAPLALAPPPPPQQPARELASVEDDF